MFLGQAYAVIFSADRAEEGDVCLAPVGYWNAGIHGDRLAIPVGARGFWTLEGKAKACGSIATLQSVGVLTKLMTSVRCLVGGT